VNVVIITGGDKRLAKFQILPIVAEPAYQQSSNPIQCHISAHRPSNSKVPCSMLLRSKRCSFISNALRYSR